MRRLQSPCGTVTASRALNTHFTFVPRSRTFLWAHTHNTHTHPPKRVQVTENSATRRNVLKIVYLCVYNNYTRVSGPRVFHHRRWPRITINRAVVMVVLCARWTSLTRVAKAKSNICLEAAGGWESVGVFFFIKRVKEFLR